MTNKSEIRDIVKYLKNYDGKEINLMEVCGTHTASIAKNAIESLISPKINLISGPGCPVCVTVSEYIDKLCKIALDDEKTVVTFSDMLRVRGSRMSLFDTRVVGGDIRNVYSPFEILNMAEKDKEKTFVFAAVGFETTSPIYAILADEIINRKINNIKFLTSMKVMPPAIEYICDNSPKVDGFLAPGHVSVITGSKIFIPIAEKYSKPFVVSGFEADEILASIYLLIKERGKGTVKNLYKKAVNKEANSKAEYVMNKYFEKDAAAWRGLGIIEKSGVYFKEQYSFLDAGSRGLIKDLQIQSGCRCADVLSGKIKSRECPLFGKLCTPDNPIGACMVSQEGSCFNYYVSEVNL